MDVGRAEEEGRAERERKANDARLNAAKEIAAAEGRVLDALNATLQNRREQLEFQIKYRQEQLDSVTNAKQELAILEARERVLKQTADSAAKIASAFKLPRSELANFAADLGRATTKIGDPEEGLFGSMFEAAKQADKLTLSLRSIGS